MYNAEKTQSAKRTFDIEKIGAAVLKKALYGLIGYFSGLCTLPFGANPFGVAMLAASDKNAIFIYLGLILSVFADFNTESDVLLLGVYSVLLLARVLVRLTIDCPFPKGSKQSLSVIASELCCERAGYRVIAAACVAVAYGSIVLSVGGFLFYDLFALFVMALCTPIAAYLFYCFFGREGIFFDIGFVAVASACVFGAAGVKIYGVSMAVLGGMILAFLVGHKRGVIRGGLCGLLFGFLYSPALAPAFAFAGLCVGVFRKFSVSLACTAAFFASVGWGFYAKGLASLDGFFAGALFACTLYSVINKLYFSGAVGARGVKKENTVCTCRVLPESELDGIRLAQMNRRMFAISDGLQGLSSFFEEMKMRFPKKDEIYGICKSAFELSCVGCSEYEDCISKGRIERAVETRKKRGTLQGRR